ncbi:helix-turn-helix domain-containing protein, partial [Aerosakkonemataceae cyanobacterium BLCC-F50]
MQQQIEAIQKLLAVQGTERYGRVQQQVAQRLGISVRSVQRLLKRWREQGIASLPRQKRSDRGAAKTSREWQEFIQKTYQMGNRGSRKMSRAQVYLRVQAEAEANGVKEYPSRPTVYRILRPLLEQQQQQKRTLGWRGEQLKVNSRE